MEREKKAVSRVATKNYEVCKEMEKDRQQKVSVFCESELCQI